MSRRPNFWLITSLLALALAACTAPTDDPKPGAGPARVTAEEKPVSGPKKITAEELNKLIQRSQAPLILDVRSEGEFAQGHIPGALNIPHDQLSGRLTELGVAKTDEIVVHCYSGHRANIAETTLDNYGYVNLRNLEGHMEGWKKGGYPMEYLKKGGLSTD
jgi:rhodanese-related sulfurtransferase